MMPALPYDVWLCHILAANIISLRPSGAISFSHSEYIISTEWIYTPCELKIKRFSHYVPYFGNAKTLVE